MGHYEASLTSLFHTPGARHIVEAEVRSALDPESAYRATERAFRSLSRGTGVELGRDRRKVGTAVLTSMWASAVEENLIGVKVYPVLGSDATRGSSPLLVLFRADSGRLVATVEAEALSALRTGAASAIATHYLARPDSRTLTIVGTGAQAWGQAVALISATPELQQILVVGRRSGSSQLDFADRLRAHAELDVREAVADEAVPMSDIIVTATTSGVPVFDGRLVRPGTHINAIGSNVASKCELDAITVSEAHVFVDDLDVAKMESGDLLMCGHDFANVTAIASVIEGTVAGRLSEEDVTVFESQGLAVEDIFCAATVLVETGVAYR